MPFVQGVECENIVVDIRVKFRAKTLMVNVLDRCKPLGNVREASETAAALLANPPGRIGSTLKALKRRYA